ncbi:MAG: GIY-YIG nuclease family protein [Enterobacteriaceae bacterium]
MAKKGVLTPVPWYLYIVRTTSGVLYTGITTDISRRISQHERGKGAKNLRGKGPLTLVYQQTVVSRSAALQLEYRIKQLSRQKKEQLIAGMIQL